MRIALDLDNTINGSRQSITFFSALSRLFTPAHEIVIIANREPGSEQQIAAELKKLDVVYTNIIITANKAEYILKHGIEVFFEDTDEYFLSLPEDVLVFKIREDGNFDFAEKKWVGSRQTVRLIDE